MQINNLSELKEIVDYIRPNTIVIDATFNEVWFYIGLGRKLCAIKAYRNITGKGLKECKYDIESMTDASTRFTYFND